MRRLNETPPSLSKNHNQTCQTPGQMCSQWRKDGLQSRQVNHFIALQRDDGRQKIKKLLKYSNNFSSL
jgi:hypothetical protein